MKADFFLFPTLSGAGPHGAARRCCGWRDAGPRFRPSPRSASLRKDDTWLSISGCIFKRTSDPRKWLAFFGASYAIFAGRSFSSGTGAGLTGRQSSSSSSGATPAFIPTRFPVTPLNSTPMSSSGPSSSGRQRMQPPETCPNCTGGCMDQSGGSNGPSVCCGLASMLQICRGGETVYPFNS